MSEVIFISCRWPLFIITSHGTHFWPRKPYNQCNFCKSPSRWSLEHNHPTASASHCADAARSGTTDSSLQVEDKRPRGKRRYKWEADIKRWANRIVSQCNIWTFDGKYRGSLQLTFILKAALDSLHPYADIATTYGFEPEHAKHGSALPEGTTVWLFIQLFIFTLPAASMESCRILFRPHAYELQALQVAGSIKLWSPDYQAMNFR